MPVIPHAVTYFAALAPQRVDVETGRIEGMCLMQVGPALGHGTSVDGTTLDQLVTLCKALPEGKAHLVVKHDGHPLDVVADLTNFRRDGDVARCDAEVFQEYPDRKRFLEIAKRSPGAFGVSAEFKRTDEMVGTTKFARVTKVRRFALERDTAASPNGLFCEVTNPDDTDSMTLDEIKAAFAETIKPLADKVTALETKFSEAPKAPTPEEVKARDEALVLDGLTKFAAKIGIKEAPKNGGGDGEQKDTNFASKVKEYAKLGMAEDVAILRAKDDFPKLYAEANEHIFGKHQ